MIVMGAKEQKVFNSIQTIFRENNIQPIVVDDVKSTVYTLKTRKFNAISSIKEEIKEFIDSKKLKHNVVFLYEVTSIQMQSNTIDNLEWIYTMRFDLQ